MWLVVAGIVSVPSDLLILTMTWTHISMNVSLDSNLNLSCLGSLQDLVQSLLKHCLVILVVSLLLVTLGDPMHEDLHFGWSMLVIFL
jgi:hypothetical protein